MTSPEPRPPICRPSAHGRTWTGWGAVGLGGASLLVGRLGDYLPLQTPYAAAPGRRHAATPSLATLAVGCLAFWWGASPAPHVGFRRSRIARRGFSPRGRRVLRGGLDGAESGPTPGTAHRGWDLGYYTQLAWQLAHLPVSREAPCGTMRPGETTRTFILAVVAPFLRVIPHPATLLAVQSVVLSLGAVPAYILGRRLWGTPLSGFVAAVAYLLYPPLQFANLFDFHADAFATPILLAAFAACSPAGSGGPWPGPRCSLA